MTEQSTPDPATTDLPAEEAGDEHERRGLADHPLTAARLAKVEGSRAAGTEPYPVGFRRTHTSEDVRRRHGDLEAGASTGETVTVAGRVMLKRSFGKLVFATLQDGAGRIQIMAQRDELGNRLDELEDLDVGDTIGATGEVVTTRKGELSVRVSDFSLLAKGLRPLPEKWHGLSDIETRSRRRYLDLIVNPDSRAVAIARARIVSELRRQFETRGYLEVETPVLLTQAGGALARPFETHHNALDIGMYLRIATELPLKMLIVGGLEKVFEIGRIFRNEGIDGTHNPEFTMLESYEAYADYHDILGLVEEVVSSVAVSATGSSVIEYQGRALDLTPPFRRARMVDLVAEAVGEPVWPAPDDLADIAARNGVEVDAGWGPGKVIEAMFDELVEHTIWEPVFVMDHPVEISPLARRHRHDDLLTERFELFIAGAEYANAYSELNDPIDQRGRFTNQAAARAAGDSEAHVVDEAFLRALEYGMPPTGGLGIGVDRLVMLLTDQTHIRDVILFPTMRPED
jgi:lysyl-tRNA synthetase, class II